MGSHVPADSVAVFEGQYEALFTNPWKGKPTKPAWMAIGALIIKKRYGFSDEDTVEEIRENPCLVVFPGLRGVHECPAL